MNNNIKENFIDIKIPPLSIPPVPNVNNVNIDICDQTARLINNSIIPPLNTATSTIISGINRVSTDIRTGIITSMGGIDIAVSTSTNGINTCIDAINHSSTAINKVVTFFESIFNVNTFFDFIKTFITFILLTIIPDDQIPNVTWYATLTIYLLIFIFIISPIISLIFFLF
jgi:type III secretory pathway component EscU